MDKVILTDKTEFEVLENSSLSNIKIRVKKVSDIKQVIQAFRDENLTTVTFTHDGEARDKYLDLKYDYFLCAPHLDEDGANDGTYDMSIFIRPKTKIEKAIEGLKTQQELISGAIDDLASIMANTERSE